MTDPTPLRSQRERRSPPALTLAALSALVLVATVAAGRMEARGYIVATRAPRPPKPPIVRTPTAPTSWTLVDAGSSATSPTPIVTVPDRVQPDAAVSIATRPDNTATATVGASLEVLQARSEREVCDHWLEAQRSSAPSQWSSRTDASCARPAVDPRALTDAHRMLNAFRWLSGVRSVAWQPEFERDVNDCAVMMDRAESLSHTPSSSWPCYSAEGARGAGASNLTLISPDMDASSAVETFINETVESLGHRRWCLYPRLAPTTIGVTARAMCMRVRTAQGVAVGGDTPTIVAFPNPGFAPIANFRTGLWSVQDGSVEVRGATVRVSDARTGNPLAIDQRELQRGYGGSAISFRPQGWSPAVGEAYRVAVTLSDGRVVAWTTTPARCGGARSGPGGESRGWRPATPTGAIELAPDAAIPDSPGVYVSWSTDDQAAVTRVITTVNTSARGRVFREESRVFLRGGGGRSSTRGWSGGGSSGQRPAITFGGGGLTIQ